jgi:hypothetical protein
MAKKMSTERYVVIAYVGDYEPDSQPHWAEIHRRLDIARITADLTWEWLLRDWIRQHHSTGDEMRAAENEAAVIVWRVPSQPGEKDGEFTLDEPELKNVAYIRGVWYEEP